MRPDRARLVSLWLSQTARVLADWCLRMAVFAGLLARDVRSAWHLTTAVSIAPYIVLAPVNGVLTNTLPRRGVLIASALYTLVALAACSVLGLPGLVCLG